MAWQCGAEARPEYRDDHIRFGGTGNLFLEGGRCHQRLVLPEDGFQVKRIAVLSVEPADDAPRDQALFGHITRRGYEDTEGLERH